MGRFFWWIVSIFSMTKLTWLTSSDISGQITDMTWWLCPWAVHSHALCFFYKKLLFSTRQTNILAILASSETISTWGKRQLIWGRRQLPSPCCGCIKLFLPAYCEKQPGIGLYRALSKCIAHGFYKLPAPIVQFLNFPSYLIYYRCC